MKATVQKSKKPFACMHEAKVVWFNREVSLWTL